MNTHTQKTETTMSRTSKVTAKLMLTGVASTLLIAGLSGPASAMQGHGRAAAPRFVSATGEQSSVAPFTSATAVTGFKGEANPRRHVVNVNLPQSLSADERMVQPGASPKVIIGADNRVQVTNTTPSWARQTVLIWSKVDGWCTGFLIGPDTVATAAHCVYHHEVGKTAGWWDYQHETVYPGYNGVNAPYGTCSVRTVWTNTNWINVASNWDYDYGAIKLNCTIGNSLGWYGYTSGGYSTATTLYTQGYPSDKANYSMWFTSGNVTGTRSFGQLLTNIDIIPGQSGSPVYQNFSGCGWCAIGIVSWSPSAGGTANGLNRINANSMALFAQVKAS